MSTIRDTLKEAIEQLAPACDSAPNLEAELLLASILQKNRTYLHTWPEKTLNPPQKADFHRLIARRIKGEPIAYILGQREFWSLDLLVTPDTLIPRPETELLVEQALALIPKDSQFQIADMGTGCGAIAAAIASERPLCQVFASDQSEQALTVATTNFKRLGLSNVSTLLGHWYQAYPKDKRFDLILSNPPYVADADPHLGQGDLRWEPQKALVSGIDGLDDIRHIIQLAPKYLTQDGWLLLEHGYDQGTQIRNLLSSNGFSQVRTQQDLAGLERLSMGNNYHKLQQVTK